MNTLKNSVNLIGRLGNDPQIHTFADDKKLARIGIITTDRYKNKDGEYINDAQWHNLVAFGSKVQFIEKYIRKGTEVAISGKLVNRSYEDSNGDTKRVTEIRLLQISLIGKPAGTAA